MPTQCTIDNLRLGEFVQTNSTQWHWGKVTYIDHYNHQGKVCVTVKLTSPAHTENFWITDLSKLEFITPELENVLDLLEDSIEKSGVRDPNAVCLTPVGKAYLLYKQSLLPKITIPYLKSLSVDQLEQYCSEVYPALNDEDMLLELYRNGQEIKATNKYSVQLAYTIWQVSLWDK